MQILGDVRLTDHPKFKIHDAAVVCGVHTILRSLYGRDTAPPCRENFPNSLSAYPPPIFVFLASVSSLHVSNHRQGPCSRSVCRYSLWDRVQIKGFLLLQVAWMAMPLSSLNSLWKTSRCSLCFSFWASEAQLRDVFSETIP
jgi:hypothetical protein